MPGSKERILVVENDPMVADLISRQALTPLGYEVKVVADGNSALQATKDFAPDVVIANLNLPGLSGKDLMVALNSQVITFPVIMIAPGGKEKDVIQAFRLGASDYIGSPVREAELVSAVERALEQVRARQERHRLAMELQRTNKQLGKRVKELTTMFGIGKAVTSITSQDKLYEAIVEGALNITESDIGWLLIKDEVKDEFILTAHLNLPKSIAANMNNTWDDGLSSFVAKSGETFSIHGEALERFPVSAMGKSALVAPVNVNKQTIAVLTVMRKKDLEFKKSDVAMLEAVSDYASISMVNARLFQALDERAAILESAVESANENETAKNEIIQYIGQQLRTPLAAAQNSLDTYISDAGNKVNKKQLDMMKQTQSKIERAVEIVDAMEMLESLSVPKDLKDVNLNDLANQAVGFLEESAGEAGIKFKVIVPSQPQYVYVDADQIQLVFAALLSNAIKFSPAGGDVVIEVHPENSQLQVSIQDHGVGISKRDAERIFERFVQLNGAGSGLGIGLTMARAIVNAHGGKVWMESKIDAGSTFHFTLQSAG